MTHRPRHAPGSPSTKATTPSSAHEWAHLLQLVIQKAAEREDPRLHSLRQAAMDGRAESCLRKMAIICETDVMREFPPLPPK
jgi:hypothetical protein